MTLYIRCSSVQSRLKNSPSQCYFHTSVVCCQNRNANTTLTQRNFFEANSEDKNKETFLAAINMYYTRDVQRRAHVEFIQAALKQMEEFGVHQDLQAYKNILDVFPKGKYIPTNMWQVEFMHHPKQQFCALDLLEQMEQNGVMPDAEMQKQMMNIFGRHGFPTKKLMRMSYWMPKFKNMSPWALPQKLPNSAFELAKIAMKRMTTVDPATEIEIFQTTDVADSIDNTWIVSGQSPTQKELIEKMKDHETVYVEGAFCLWLRKSTIHYFILRSEPVKPTEEVKKSQDLFDYDDTSQLRSWILGEEVIENKDVIILPSVHEQEDGNILAIGITGSSSKDSLLSWIRCLQKKNPRLASLPILFSTHSPLGEVVPAVELAASQSIPKITDKA